MLGVPPKVLRLFHYFDGVQLQSVGTVPEDQLFIMSDETDDCCVVCTLQEFNRKVLEGAVINGP